jgi:hypothetical protein
MSKGLKTPIDEGRHISRDALIELLSSSGEARLTQVFGGARVFTPAVYSPGFDRFAGKLGEEIARKFCAEFGSLWVILPPHLVPLDAQIVKLHREQIDPAEIAGMLGCTKRYVDLVLSRE